MATITKNVLRAAVGRLYEHGWTIENRNLPRDRLIRDLTSAELEALLAEGAGGW
jgi:hypothetical protein